MSSIEQRRQFVIDRVISASKKQSTTRENSRRSQTWLYFIDMESGQRIQICKTVFYNTLQVKEKFVRYALKASELGVAKKDQRGKHAPIHKMSLDDKQRLRDHINMFPKVDSHYVRKDSKKQYISDTSNFNKLTVMRMYQLYCQMCTSNDQRACSYEIYRRELKDMNIAIHKPKKDQCKSCIAFGHKLSPTDKDIEEHEVHLKRRKEAYNMKETMKKRAVIYKKTIAFTFDLEAVLYTPCSKVSTLFYKRKLCTYNLTMFN